MIYTWLQVQLWIFRPQRYLWCWNQLQIQILRFKQWFHCLQLNQTPIFSGLNVDLKHSFHKHSLMMCRSHSLAIVPTLSHQISLMENALPLQAKAMIHTYWILETLLIQLLKWHLLLVFLGLDLIVRPYQMHIIWLLLKISWTLLYSREKYLRRWL